MERMRRNKKEKEKEKEEKSRIKGGRPSIKSQQQPGNALIPFNICQAGTP